nr:immunoglobulin heavy chain junction region [Macaca mulatta]
CARDTLGSGLDFW